MKKKIYVVKEGRRPGIYDNWADTADQVLGYSGARYRSFTYRTEKEDEDDTVEMSHAWALKMANEYLASDPEKPAAQVCPPERESDFREAEKAAVKEELESNLYKKILAPAGLRTDSYGNSPWVAMLLNHKNACMTIDSKDYTSRYSCEAIYTALLYLVLDSELLLEKYENRLFRRRNRNPENAPAHDDTPDDYSPDDYDAEEIQRFRGRQKDTAIARSHGDMPVEDNISIEELWHQSEDYIQLKALFEKYKMEAFELPEVRYRHQAKELTDIQAYTKKIGAAFVAMRTFVKEGGHTVMGLYRELVGNPVYRDALTFISGSFHNPDLASPTPKETYTPSSVPYVKERTDAIAQKLYGNVIGQDDAIKAIADSYFQRELELLEGNTRQAPRHVFLFAGPSGVGKTFIAELMAKEQGIPYKRFDMSAYSHYSNAQDLVGSNITWKSATPGVLTQFVRENPHCVLLFDEIEKACREVIVLFLQILDAGRCEDKYYDEMVDFRDTVIIFTTNAGKQLYQDAEKENLTLLSGSVILDALRKDKKPNSEEPYFPPEIVSRMSSHTVIMFNHLRAGHILEIIRRDLKKQVSQKRTLGYDIESGIDMLAFTSLYFTGAGMDARNAATLAGKMINKWFYGFLTRAEEKSGLDSHSRKITWIHDFSEAPDEIRQFYEGQKDCVIAIFGQADSIENPQLTENHVRIKITEDRGEFEAILSRDNVLFAAVDYEYGTREQERILSITDRQTEGGSIFSYVVREYRDNIPVYILCNGTEEPYSRSERLELCRRGARGFLRRGLIKTDIPAAYMDVCCQTAMETLSLRHQRLAFETKIDPGDEQTTGRITFCNFTLETAAEAEDKDLLLSADMLPNKHWADIYVSELTKKELESFIQYLQNPKIYIQKKARVPKGVLMTGNPGTGKTSLAKVVATESGVSFLEIGADVLRTKGADEIHRVFRTARKYAPAVLFIDELDAIAKDRSVVIDNGTLNALLTEMDGFKKLEDKPVFVMAATNLEEQIDSALKRRFDRTLEIPLPGKRGIKWKLDQLTADKNVFEENLGDIIDSITVRALDKSFADIENIVAAAVRESIRAGRRVDSDMLNEAFESMNYGEAREHSPESVRHTACHEAGHALIELHYGHTPKYMNVVARGSFGGYVQPHSSDGLSEKESLLERICMVLGGRAAELEFGYGITGGASSDLEQATILARHMVCELGMYEEEAGLAVMTPEDLRSNAKALAVINRILSEQLQEARRIIAEKRDILERLVQAVMDSDSHYLTSKELEAIYHGR